MLFSATLMGVLTACKRDLGNYDYNSNNTISISTDITTADPKMVINNDSVVVKQNDTLKLNVVLSQTKESDNLSYSWMVTQATFNGGNPGQYVIGNTKQLNAKITMPPGLYRLVIKVTDNKTGVSFYKFYSLNVDTSPFGNEGWVVLQENTGAGGCDISIITTRDGTTAGLVYPNVYSLANGHPLPAGTRKVNVMNYNSALRIQKISFLHPNGAIQVRSTDYADSSISENWFFVNPPINNIQANGLVSNGAYEYLINNNQLHYRSVNAQSIKTPPILFSAPVLGTWTLTPFVVNNNTLSDYWFTIYDQANKCFFLLNASNNTLSGGLADVPNKHFLTYSGAASALDPITGSGFDLNNVGKNLVYTENAQPLQNGTGTPMYDYIFRNNAGDSTWLIQFASAAVVYTNNISSGRYYLDAALVPGINTSSMFAVPYLGTTGTFYYTSANHVYNCTLRPVATSTAAAQLNYPAGTVIKVMKVFKSGYNSGAPSTDGKVLVVATDETSSGGGYKVYFYNIDVNGNIINTPVQTYTGFDKIVDIAFKKGLGL